MKRPIADLAVDAPLPLIVLLTIVSAVISFFVSVPLIAAGLRVWEWFSLPPHPTADSVTNGTVAPRATAACPCPQPRVVP